MIKRVRFPICLVLGLTFAVAKAPPLCSASTTASAKPSKKPRAKARKLKTRIKAKAKKTKTKTKTEKTPEKAPQKTTPADPSVGPKVGPPKPIIEVGNARWTDPIELRDTLFLSAVARQLRSP